MKLLIQVAADTAWNHDLVSHSPYPRQTKKPNSAFGLCVPLVLKGTVNMKFNQIQTGELATLLCGTQK